MISVESASGAFNPAAMEATMVYGVAFEDNVRAVMEDADGHHFRDCGRKEWNTMMIFIILIFGLSRFGRSI